MHRAAKYHTKQRHKLHSVKTEKLSSVNQKIKHLLRFATLAPSTHNTQPWYIKLDSNEVKIFADFSKSIPIADPLNRYLYISLGAFVKNLELAAQSFGLNINLKKFDSYAHNKEHPVAIFTIDEIAKNKLKTVNQNTLQAISKRQNYRGLFSPKLNTLDLQKYASKVSNDRVQISLVTNKADIQKLATLTAEGLKKAYTNPSFRREIAELINHNISRKRHGLHGYSLRMNFIQSLVVPRAMKRKDIGDKLSKLNYASFISAPVVFVLNSKELEKAWLECGEAMQDILIWLTEKNLTASIYVASLETESSRGEVSKIAKTKKGLNPQILFCAGKGTDKMPHSARHKLKKVARL